MRTIQQIEMSLAFLQSQVQQEKTALRDAKAEQRKMRKSQPEYGDDEKTYWHKGDYAPGISGVYERWMKFTEEPPENKFSYWNGSSWFIGAATPLDAAGNLMHSKHQDLPWRGLKINPEPF